MELRTITLIGGPLNKQSFHISPNRNQLSLPVMISGQMMRANYTDAGNDIFTYKNLRPVTERSVISTQQPTAE